MRVAMVEWTRATNGGGLLRIDEGKTFEVKRGEAEVLEVLLEDRSEADDGLIDWKEQTYIRARVGRKAGRTVSPGALRTRIYRLRGTLERAGYDRRLIQCHLERGMRFALLRSS